MTTPRHPPAFLLNDGHSLPAVGLGTAGMTGEHGITAIVSALQAGYRLLDTATGYRNEAEVGEAIRRSGVPADEVIVTTKIWARDHGYDTARRAVETSLDVLGVEVIGLHLIHWPNPGLDRYVETWRALVDAQADGEIRSIGVSNFTPPQLQRLIDETGTTPAVNQVELHPHFPQEAQREINDELGILTQSWSPLGRGADLLTDPAISGPARRHSASAAQVVLQWHHQLGCLPLPRSSSSEHQLANLSVGEFTLRPAEMEAITALGNDGGRLWGGDPDTTTL